MKKPKKKPIQLPVVEYDATYTFRCPRIKDGRMQTVVVRNPYGKVGTSRELLSRILGQILWVGETRSYGLQDDVVFDSVGTNGVWNGEWGGRNFYIKDLSFAKAKKPKNRCETTQA